MNRRPKIPIPFAIIAALRQERARARVRARAEARWMMIVARSERSERRARDMLLVNTEILRAFINESSSMILAQVEEI